jgi:site-specific recombinase XerD
VDDQIADLSASFARSLCAEMRAARTVKLYGMSTRMFADWLVTQGQPTTLDQLPRDNIREWLAHLAVDREASTVRIRFKGLHRFCGWLVAEGEIDVHPMAGMAPPESAPKPVPVLQNDELAALLVDLALPAGR